MNENRRFEDKVEIEELMNTPPKELMARIYQQVLKTNGTVAQNCNDIKDLKDDVKDKIGMKLFAVITGIVGLIILIFNILDRVMA